MRAGIAWGRSWRERDRPGGNMRSEKYMIEKVKSEDTEM